MNRNWIFQKTKTKKKTVVPNKSELVTEWTEKENVYHDPCNHCLEILLQTYGGN